LRKHAEVDRGRNIKPSTRTVEQFLTEWLGSVKHSLKPSAHTNYSTNVSAYIIPKIGRRKLQDISVPVLNAFYVHLLEAGRGKTDGNGRMYSIGATAARSAMVWAPPPPNSAKRAARHIRQLRRPSVATEGAGYLRSTSLACHRSRCVMFTGCCIERSATPSRGTTWSSIRRNTRACPGRTAVAGTFLNPGQSRSSHNGYGVPKMTGSRVCGS
jgi:hypothetical protein